MSFTELGLSAPLAKALGEIGIKDPNPVQQQVIPKVLEKKDVLGIAPTGSGKTAAFVLPLLELSQDAPKLKNRHIRVLVIVPTRELAVQADDNFLLLGRYMPHQPKSTAVYGGVSINPQMIRMQNVEILVATPGRLLDLIDSNALSLSQVETLVIDEADKMLNSSFMEEMDRILGLLPEKRQNLLFSATLTEDLEELNRLVLNEPEIVKIVSRESDISLIEQSAYYVSPERKGPLLRYVIKSGELQQVLVFASAIRTADNIVVKLMKNGIPAAAFHGDKSQGARMASLKKFAEGKLRVLVATDLAGRGIDIPELQAVINYELPRSPKDYIHRIGRTGRAGNAGQAISLISPDEEHHFKVIQKKMGRKVPMIDSEEIELHGY
jgi:ATP-dependent RNA helicase RhlE